MAKLIPTKPLLILLYGFPGSGKTHFARQLSEAIGGAHVHGDRIRGELFDQPRYDQQENGVVNHLMQYMTEEFLRAGISVVYDTNASRFADRRKLRDLARKTKTVPVLIWLQIDTDSALARLGQRDRRRLDDRYAASYDRAAFEETISQMQNPHNTEEYIVISGKHTFGTQRSAVTKRFYEMGLIATDQLTSSVVKPGLVNLIPNPAAGRVDMTRRNIVIR